MESEPVRPGHSTLFDCNLVWETNRSSIKRMKAENLPVKLECYALKDFKRSVEDATKEHIGYILMPVKNIPILSLNKAFQMKPRWMRLIGLSKDWRQHKPELLVNVMITSKEYLTCDKNEVLESQTELEASDSVVIEENPIPRMLTSQQGIFIRLLQDEGLLQVGNIDTEQDIFRVHILIKGIRNIETISNGKSDELFFNYVVLGNEHMRALDRKFNRLHQIQEKISINFRSSLRSLREYFDKVFFIPFEINSGSVILGESEIRINNLIRSLNMDEFLKENPQEESSTIQIKSSSMSNQNQPTLEIKTVIKYIETKKLLHTEILEKYKKRHEIDTKAGGDNKSEKSVKFDEKNPPDNEKLELKSDGKSIEKVSIASDVENVVEKKKSDEMPKVFCHTIHIDSVKFGRKPEKGVWQFILFNDRADIVKNFVNREITENENLEVQFEDLQLKLYFTSPSSQIEELIQSSENCTLTIKGPRSYQVKAHLDCKNLIPEKDGDKVTGIILLQSASEDLNAMVKITVNLEVLGLNFNSQFKNELERVESQTEIETRSIEDRKALLMDEDLTYKMIEELELWKENQKKIFLEELKTKEKKFLEHLKESWNKKQDKLESELHEKAEKLACMTRSLEEAKNIMSEKMPGYTEQDIDRIRKKLSEYYQNEIQNLKEESLKNEADLHHEMRMIEIKLDEHERNMKITEQENNHLKEKCQKLEEKLIDTISRHEYEKLFQENVSKLTKFII